jgi:hypothetical protein
LHFCDYLPFEKDLALYLNNLEFPVLKSDLCQVWLKLACWFCMEKKIFFNINICKYSFPYCGPSGPPGTMMWTILNLHYIRKLSCKYDLFSGSVVLEKKIFKWSHPIFAFFRSSPLWRGPGPLFEEFRIPFTQG